MACGALAPRGWMVGDRHIYASWREMQLFLGCCRMSRSCASTATPLRRHMNGSTQPASWR
eukprot:1893950-Prorocentrum_lima.AAC.1